MEFEQLLPPCRKMALGEVRFSLSLAMKAFTKANCIFCKRLCSTYLHHCESDPLA